MNYFFILFKFSNILDQWIATKLYHNYNKFCYKSQIFFYFFRSPLSLLRRLHNCNNSYNNQVCFTFVFIITIIITQLVSFQIQFFYDPLPPRFHYDLPFIAPYEGQEEFIRVGGEFLETILHSRVV